jgi:MerR family transcriptional regulator, light-induced transcriptional regulator
MLPTDIPLDDAADLNLKQAAARLGVHYMTAYRYVRQGHLAAHRAGTAWRVTEETLATFTTRRRPHANASADDSHRGAARVDWRARLETHLLAGDEPAAWDTVERALAAGHDPSFCYLEMVAGALANIGARWFEGELDAADEPLATAVATRVVARLGARFRRSGRSRGSVVFGAPTGERHSLPIAIVADLVRIHGFDVLELGADVPPAAFVAATTRAPRLVAVGIGVTSVERWDAVRATINALRQHNHDVPILIGGQAVLNAEIADLAGATAWAADGREAVKLIETIASTPRRPTQSI